jgi:hypothetical protein
MMRKTVGQKSGATVPLSYYYESVRIVIKDNIISRATEVKI